MKNPARILMALALTTLLSGCVLFHGYVPTVQQGNIISNQKVNQIRVGSSKSTVLRLLGSPVYVNTFGTRWVYIYTLKKQGQDTFTRKAIISFRNDAVTSIKKDLPPAPKQSSHFLGF